MATHSILLAWRIPWTEEPGRLWAAGLHESDMTEQLVLTLLFIKWITSKDVLCSTGNATHSLVITYKGKESVKESIYIYM